MTSLLFLLSSFFLSLEVGTILIVAFRVYQETKEREKRWGGGRNCK